MARWGLAPTTAVTTLAALVLAACAPSNESAQESTTSQTPMSSTPETTAPVAISARELLLPSGERTSRGPAVAAPPGDTYFTSAEPPDCAAAVVLKDSPLSPAGASDHADSAYRIGVTGTYTESISVYPNDVDTEQLGLNGFDAVSGCKGDAVGVADGGHRTSMRLNQVAVVADGVLEWAMISPDWSCNYAWAVSPRATLLVSACENEGGLPLGDWATTRSKQIQSQLG
jgi:hypothetical protein